MKRARRSLDRRTGYCRWSRQKAAQKPCPKSLLQRAFLARRPLALVVLDHHAKNMPRRIAYARLQEYSSRLLEQSCELDLWLVWKRTQKPLLEFPRLLRGS
ncbi:MAG: hypothetical protein V4525_08405 [Pseudomonadota bacterium]